MDRRAHIVVSGRVQGVGYRSFVEWLASRLELTGFVRNKMSGEVELVTEGDEEKIKKLVEDLKKGPALARVDRVDVDWQAHAAEFDSFFIRHTV